MVKTHNILKWFVLAVFAAAILWLGAQAFAAPVAVPEGDTSAKVDLSEYVTWGLNAAFALGLALWAQVKGILPGPARWAIEVMQIDQVVENSIRNWLSQNAGKISGKASFTVDLRSQMVRDVVVMALNTGNKFVQKNRGSLVDKVNARLEKYIQENFK